MPTQRQRWTAFLHVAQADTGLIVIQPAPTAPKQLFLQQLHVSQSVAAAVTGTIESTDAAVVFAHIPATGGVGVKVQVNLPYDGPGIPFPVGTGLRMNIGGAGNRLQIAASGYVENVN